MFKTKMNVLHSRGGGRGGGGRHLIFFPITTIMNETEFILAISLSSFFIGNHWGEGIGSNKK